MSEFTPGDSTTNAQKYYSLTCYLSDDTITREEVFIVLKTTN